MSQLTVAFIAASTDHCLMEVEKRVCWVLGAGFSRSLDGPLLDTFFGPHRMDQLRARLPDDGDLALLEGHHAELIPSLFLEGKKRSAWRDAEAFLDYLDSASAAEDSPAMRRICQMLKVAAPDLLTRKRSDVASALHTYARRMVAAECIAFLEGQDVGQESWQPYWDWLRLVQTSDSIITFNYDLLVETLLDLAPKQGFTVVPACVLAPGKSPQPKCAPVMKLHGSVDWRKVDAGYELGGNKKLALRCEGTQLGIASPGATKLRESKGGLGSLWRVAHRALQEADAIVFLGYRFPPSDAHARGTFVDALTGGFNSKRHVSAHVVLGPNSRDADRTCQILHYAFRRGGRDELPPPRRVGYQVISQPLTVEDFLTVISREQLFAPTPHNPTRERWARHDAREQEEISKLVGG